jgi:uncharacterized membrane protein
VNTERLETFSDGVFAIAITLLILEVRPHGTGSLQHQLLAAWPSYIAYLISFVTIGIMWANHHGIFQLISRCTHGLLIANMLLLMCIAFIPFPTRVLAEHLQHGGPDQTTAVVFFNLTYFVTAIFYNLVWQTAAWKHRLIAPEHRGAADQVTRRFWAGSPSYLIATLVSLRSAAAGVALNGALALFYLLPRRAATS